MSINFESPPPDKSDKRQNADSRRGVSRIRNTPSVATLLIVRFIREDSISSPNPLLESTPPAAA